MMIKTIIGGRSRAAAATATATALAGRCACARLLSTSKVGAPGSESFYQFNWLEEDCGDVPAAPRALDMETSEMLRGGHALQVASANLIDVQVRTAEVTECL